MKMRLGFVSNSSSVSFVIDKCDVNPKHMDELRKFLHTLYETDCADSPEVFETEKHFFGSRSMHNEKFRAFLNKHQIVVDEMM